MKNLLKKNRNFRNFWIASSISTIGDFVDDIAFAQLVYIVTKSTLITSYVFAIKIIFSFLYVCFCRSIFQEENIIDVILVSGDCFIGLARIILLQLGQRSKPYHFGDSAVSFQLVCHPGKKCNHFRSGYQGRNHDSAR